MSESLEFIHVDSAFSTVKLPISISESHGLLCGMLCANEWVPIDQWLNAILDEEHPSDSAVFDQMAQTVYQFTQKQMTSGGVELYPLVPDDDEALESRLAAISEWCQGYLAGIGMVEPPLDAENLPEEVNEILTDFANISQVDIYAESTSESESDFVELIEYIKVSMLLVFEHLQSGQTKATVH